MTPWLACGSGALAQWRLHNGADKIEDTRRSRQSRYSDTAPAMAAGGPHCPKRRVAWLGGTVRLK
jgi:hypothetical protein